VSLKAPLWARNIFSRIMGLPVICPKCGREMVETGKSKRGINIYKCLVCDKK